MKLSDFEFSILSMLINRRIECTWAISLENPVLTSNSTLGYIVLLTRACGPGSCPSEVHLVISDRFPIGYQPCATPRYSWVILNYDT